MASREQRARAALVAATLFLLALPSKPGFGGGARRVDGAGQPMLWDNQSPITYNTDLGALGTLTQALADALVADSFAHWQAVPLVDLTFAAGAPLPVNVDAVGFPSSNPAHWANYWGKEGDGYSPIIYDADGSVVDDMFGAGARFELLGAATIDDPISLGGVITEASMVINGAFLDGAGLPSSPTDATSEAAFQATIVHESGHWLNLNHSLVNHEVASDADPENDRFVPTMYPLTVADEEAILTLNPDDEAAVLALYPGPLVATTRATFAGEISKGGIPFQGAQVVARRTDNPLMFAYEAVSGATFFPCNVGGTCYPCDPFGPTCNPGNPPARGSYTVDGLPPGTYTICVEQMDRRISAQNGTFIGPLPVPPVLPGPEECLTRPPMLETASDDPDTASPRTASAGIVLSGLNIILNDLPSADLFEPNNTLAAASTLPGLVAMNPRDSIGAVLDAGDLDFYQVSVLAGDTYQVDVEASEIGSTLDPVLGLYDGAGVLIQVIDDAVDPDSGVLTPDPAITYRATFTGSLRLALGSYPDLGLNGTDGATPGPYWLRVIHDEDADGDGVFDRFDAFPTDPLDDEDDDGVPAPLDNCPHVSNSGQANADGDAHGDACDTTLPVATTGFVFSEGGTAGAHLGAAVTATDTNGDGLDDVIMGMPDFPDETNMPKGAWRYRWGTPAGRASGSIWEELAATAPGAYGSSLAAGHLTCDNEGEVVVADPIDNLVELWGYNQPFQGLASHVNYAASEAGAQRFGHSVAIVGDVEGDGGTDVLMADQTFAAGGASRGRVYLFRGDPSPCNGIPDAFPDWIVSGTLDNALFGSAVAGAGDVNGDGYDDVIVGAPGDENGQTEEGRVFVYYGSINGLPTTASRTFEGDSLFAHFGSSVAGIGDVNNDTYDDVAVGAPNDSGDGNDLGTVTIFLGSPAGLPASPSMTIQGDLDHGHFGSALAGRIDVNGDGYDDLVASSPDHDAGGTERGKVFVHLGSLTGVSSTPDAILSGDQDFAHFGSSLGAADVNGDGFSDIVVGAKDYDFGETDEGRVFVYLGTDGADRDGDGVADVSDNCDTVNNPLQQDTDTAGGPNLVCGGLDDSLSLFGADGTCGTSDDIVGDGRGDACVSWSRVTGITPPSLQTTSAAWGDYDGDGDLDLWATGVPTGTTFPERLLRNDGGGVFVPTTPAAMNGMWAGGAWADYDNDGDVDLLSVGTADAPLPASKIPASCPEIPSKDAPGVVCETFDTDRNGNSAFNFTRLPVGVSGTDPLRANGDLTDDVLGFTMHGGPTAAGTNGQTCADDAGRPNCQAPVAGENDWHLHSPSEGPGAGYDPLGIPGIGAPDGGKAHGGFRSMHMGRHLEVTTTLGDTTRYRQVSAFVLDSQGNGDPNPGVVLGPASTLEFWHIMSTLDDENAGASLIPAGSAFGGGQLQVSILGVNGSFEPWRRLTPDTNGYDSVIQDSVSICAFDPGDDDFPVTDETICEMGPVWADIGDVLGSDPTCTTDTDGNDSLHNDCGATTAQGAADIQLGSVGSGVWARSSFDLSSFSGRVARLRWLYMQGGGWSFGTTRSALEPQGGIAYQYFDGDDGWWIDDLALTDLRQSPTPAGPANGNIRLLRNEGGGVFAPVSIPAAGAVIKSASWIDFDSDGDLDIYQASASGSIVLRNDGGDTFIQVLTPAIAAAHSRAWFQDYDSDGDTDVMTGEAGGTCALYRNDGGFSLTPVSVPPPHSCLNGDWGDFDGDGDPDFVAGWQILRNDGGAGFTLVPAFDGTSYLWADLDNDGDLDALHGTMARNDGGGVFTRVDEATTRSHGAGLPADFDGDGMLDSFHPVITATSPLRSRMVRNIGITPNHWLELDLRGTASSRSGIGAVLRATAGGRTLRREVSGGGAHPLRVHFGLGQARIVDTLEIRWPSGSVQSFSGVPVDRLVSIAEVDGASPAVISVQPPDSALDVSLNTDVLVRLNEAIDPATADGQSFSVSRGGVKVSGSVRVSSDGRTLTFDPIDPLEPNADYVVSLTAALRDLSGNGAIPFSSQFDSSSAAASLPLPASAIGSSQSGSVPGGVNQDARFGFAAAAVGDVNGDGIGDLIVGAPNTDNGPNADAGVVTLFFGQDALQSNAGGFVSLNYTGAGASDFAGRAVAAAGDVNGDNLADFIIGAPLASPNGAGSGKAYLVFGAAGLESSSGGSFSLASIAACLSPSLCGIEFQGEAAADQAGWALAAAGDINDDGFRDLLVGAPGATPTGRPGAGKVYLLFGPFPTPGIAPLSGAGMVFLGENPGDAAGTSVSAWNQFAGDGKDDLLIGAPLADALDKFGVALTNVGLVYAVHGGLTNLVPSPVSPPTIDLARVANAQGDQVSGMVFIGDTAGKELGRSVTGEVDIDGDLQPDIIMGANGAAWIIPGDDPKTRTGSTVLEPNPTIPPGGLIRQGGSIDSINELGATVFSPGFEGSVGHLVVAGAGDTNGDGVLDLIIGAPEADLPGKTNAGKAYLLFGGISFPPGELLLSEVGSGIPGVVIEGAEAGDQLGAAVGGGYDLNDDGIADAIMGAPFADMLPSTPQDAGEAYILSPLPAAEVPDVTAEYTTTPASPTLIEWQVADRALTYNVYRGLVSVFRLAGVVRTSAMTPLACGTNASSDADSLPDLVDAGVPPAGDAYFYLVTGSNLFGESQPGAGLGAPPRIHDGQCP